jgi:HNH endonuclease
MTLAQAMTIPESIREKTLQRLLERSRPVESGCREWIGYILPTGYGQIYVAPDICRAHRVMYAIVHGPIPEGAVVMHSCDNRKCVEPSHLSLGTIYLNGQDAKAKGRCKYQKVTHCKNGHEFNAENTRINPIDGRRACKRCQRICIRKKAGWPEWAWDLPPTPLGQRPFANADEPTSDREVKP